MTNIERIKQMSVDEMAEFFNIHFDCYFCPAVLCGRRRQAKRGEGTKGHDVERNIGQAGISGADCGGVKCEKMSQRGK